MAISPEVMRLLSQAPSRAPQPTRSGVWDDYIKPAVMAPLHVLGAGYKGIGTLASALENTAQTGDPLSGFKLGAGGAEGGLGGDAASALGFGDSLQGVRDPFEVGADALRGAIGGKGARDVDPEWEAAFRAAAPVTTGVEAAGSLAGQFATQAVLDPVMHGLGALGARAGQAAEAAAGTYNVLPEALTKAIPALARVSEGTVPAAIQGLAPETAGAVAKGLGAAFVPGMAISAAENLAQAPGAIKQHGLLSPQAVETGGQGLVDAAFAGLGAYHALRGGHGTGERTEEIKQATDEGVAQATPAVPPKAPYEAPRVTRREDLLESPDLQAEFGVGEDTLRNVRQQRLEETLGPVLHQERQRELEDAFGAEQPEPTPAAAIPEPRDSATAARAARLVELGYKPEELDLIPPLEQEAIVREGRHAAQASPATPTEPTAPQSSPIPPIEDVEAFVRKAGQVSTSLLQREYKIPFRVAGELVDALEARGVVSAADNVHPRQVLESQPPVEPAIEAVPGEKFSVRPRPVEEINQEMETLLRGKRTKAVEKRLLDLRAEREQAQAAPPESVRPDLLSALDEVKPLAQGGTGQAPIVSVPRLWEHVQDRYAGDRAAFDRDLLALRAKGAIEGQKGDTGLSAEDLAGSTVDPAGGRLYAVAKRLPQAEEKASVGPDSRSPQPVAAIIERAKEVWKDRIARAEALEDGGTRLHMRDGKRLEIHPTGEILGAGPDIANRAGTIKGAWRPLGNADSYIRLVEGKATFPDFLHEVGHGAIWSQFNRSEQKALFEKNRQEIFDKLKVDSRRMTEKQRAAAEEVVVEWLAQEGDRHLKEARAGNLKATPGWFKRFWDYVTRIVRAFKGPDAESLARDFATGQIWDRGRGERAARAAGEWLRGEGGPRPGAREAFSADTAGARSSAELEAARKAWKEKGTESPWFRRWFGESKVVDKDGKPLVVYHGTTAPDFGVFKKDAIFFTDSPDIAGGVYAEGRNELNVDAFREALSGMSDAKIRKVVEQLQRERVLREFDESSPDLRADLVAHVQNRFDSYDGLGQPSDLILESFGVKTRTGAEGGRVVPAYLALKNPLTIDAKGDAFDAWTQAEWLKSARDGGHDGIIIKNYDDGGYGGFDSFQSAGKHTVYVAFRPEQIKSATGNRGTFEAESSDIRYQVRPDTEPKPDISSLRKAVDEAKREKERLQEKGRALRGPEVAANQAAVREATKRVREAEEALLGAGKPLDENRPPLSIRGQSPRDPRAGAEGPGAPPRVELRRRYMQELRKEQGKEPFDWSSNVPQARRFLIPKVQRMLDTMTPEQLFAKTAPSPEKVMAQDAFIAGRRADREVLMAQKEKLLAEGKDDPALNAEAIANGFDLQIAEMTNLLTKYGKKQIEYNTAVARTLAAMNDIMSAGRSLPDSFLRDIFRKHPSISPEKATALADLVREGKYDALPDALFAAVEPGAWAKFLEYWKSSLVSAVGTLGVGNPGGNIGEMGARLAEAPFGVITDMLTTKLTGERSRTFGEAGAEAGAIKAAARPAWDAFKTDLGKIFRGEYGSLAELDETARRKGLHEMLQYPPAIGAGPKWAQKLLPTGHVGNAVRVPLYILSATDAMFRRLGVAAELGKLSHREAVKELGLSAPKEAVAAKASEISRLANEPGSEYEHLLGRAQEEAAKRVFQNDAPALRSLKSLRANLKGPFGMPIGHLAIPFTDTPFNIFKMMIERSPLGGIGAGKAWKRFVEAKNEGKLPVREMEKLRDNAIDLTARAALGSTMFAMFIGAAKAGMMTGAGPTDPKAKKALMETGWQPYSFRVGDTYIPFNRFEPVSSILGFSADAVEIANKGERESYVKKAAAAFMTNALSKTYLQGLSDAAGLIVDPERYGPDYAASLVGSLVPNIVAKGAQAIDPVMRETRPPGSGALGQIAATVQSRVPGASTGLPEQRTLTGEVRERPNAGSVAGAISRFALPVQVTQRKAGSELQEEFARVGYTPPVPDRKIRVSGQDIILAPSEQDKLAEEYQKASVRATRLLASPSYKAAPDDADQGQRSKRKLLDRIYAEANDRFKARYASILRARARAKAAAAPQARA